MTFVGRIWEDPEKNKKTSGKKSKEKKDNKDDKLLNLEDEDTNK